MDINTSDLQPLISRVGGKTKIAKSIIERMPPHTTYADLLSKATGRYKCN